MKTESQTLKRNLSILLVEDNPGDAFLVRQVLESSRFPLHIELSQDGVEALAYLHHDDIYQNTSLPDLILLDLDLPRKNGWDVLTSIKENPLLNKIRVIILTGSHNGIDLMKSCFSLADDFIPKPKDLDHLEIFLAYMEKNWFEKILPGKN